MLLASTLQLLGELAKVFCSSTNSARSSSLSGIRLAEVAAGIELVVPDLASRRAFLEEQHDGLHACSLERATGAIEHRVQVAAFQQQLA